MNTVTIRCDRKPSTVEGNAASVCPCVLVQKHTNTIYMSKRGSQCRVARGGRGKCVRVHCVQTVMRWRPVTTPPHARPILAAAQVQPEMRRRLQVVDCSNHASETWHVVVNTGDCEQRVSRPGRGTGQNGWPHNPKTREVAAAGGHLAMLLRGSTNTSRWNKTIRFVAAAGSHRSAARGCRRYSASRAPPSPRPRHRR